MDIPIYELKIPNVITPGTSLDVNDTFVILYGDKKISQSSVMVSLSIFNRWGGKVFQTGDYKDDWNAENQPAGVYYYEAVIEGETTCKGWVHVIR